MTDRDKKIPVVVAGTGHGLRVLAPALKQTGFDVVALVGTDQERTARRAERAGIKGAFVDLDKAIKQTGAQAVAVATPPFTHASLVHIALQNGCHVYCEKPFARNVREASEMLAAANEAGVVHLMGNQFRMMPDRTVVSRAIADGLIGEPRLVSITQFVNLVANTESRWPDWWFDTEAGGGWLGASGSHMIDMIRTWLGDFESLSAKLQVVANRKDVAEDTYLTRFTMRNGCEGILTQSGGTWGDMVASTQISGTLGTLSVEGGQVYLANADGKKELAIPEELRLPEVAPSNKPSERFLHVEIPPALRLCEAWYNAICGSPAGRVPVATFEDGLAAMEVIDAIRESSKASGKLIVV